MAKSAAVKIEEFLNECHGTRAVVQEFAEVSRTKYGDYGYAAGYLQTLVSDLIMELPKKRRQEICAQLHNKAYQLSVEV